MKTCRNCGFVGEDEDFIPCRNRCRNCDAIFSNSRQTKCRIFEKYGKKSQVGIGKVFKHVENGVREYHFIERIIKDVMESQKGKVKVSEKEVCWLYLYCVTNTQTGRDHLKLYPKVWKELHELYRKLTGRPYSSRHRKSGNGWYSTKQPGIWKEFEVSDRNGKSTGPRLITSDPGPT